MSLEPEFWRAFRAIAKAEGRALNDLAAEVDAGRGPERGLATAIRVFVLGWYEARAVSPPAPARSGAPSCS